jgi:DNA-binding MarR family transcriptional regulator
VYSCGVATRRSRDLTTAAGLVIEAANYLQRGIHADVERATGIPGPWLEVLLRLHRTPGGALRINEIASQVTLPASSFSRLADQMEAEGLVARSPDPAHRRATLLRMTTSGEERFAEIWKVFEPSMRARFGSVLSDQELDALEVITRKLREANQAGRETDAPAQVLDIGAVGRQAPRTRPLRPKTQRAKG